MWNRGRDPKPGEILGDRLAHYYFSDLYISTDPAFVPIARRLTLHGTDLRTMKGVVPFPQTAARDMEEALKLVIAEANATPKFNREPSIEYDGISYRCALISAPDDAFQTSYEEKAPQHQVWCLRRVGNEPPRLDQVNLPSFLFSSLKMASSSRGLVLISGSFGSGKTTTASACFQTWVEDTKEVGVTLEDPPEFPLGVPDGCGKIFQIDISDRDPAEAIRHARRYAPRYLFLGEIRTPQAARELLHISASGPLVICTIHSSDPIQALTSLILFASSAMEPEMAKQLTSRCISMIVHQDMKQGTIDAKLLEIKDDDYGIHSKIRSGRYDLLYEDFETQKIRRQNNMQNPLRTGVRR